MQPVDSTSKILAFKVLDRSIDSQWVDWALEMMSVGFDSEHLTILAGETFPFNQFYMQDLTSKALKELQLDYSDKDKVIRNYINHLIDKALNNESQTLAVLNLLKKLCVELDYRKDLYNFYYLYFAKLDLLDSENQWYWEGADKNNIDTIIKEQFLKWKREYHP